jgi:hypothetical protein
MNLHLGMVHRPPMCGKSQLFSLCFKVPTLSEIHRLACLLPKITKLMNLEGTLDIPCPNLNCSTETNFGYLAMSYCLVDAWFQIIPKCI